MSRLESCFSELRNAGRKALVCFVTAGDPDPDTTLATMHAMVASGANVLELGVPFSDPMADGPAIQKASERALAGGMRIATVFDVVRRFRETDARTPVVLMGYMNPIEAHGAGPFAQAAAAAGVDGLITVDMPPEESAVAAAAFREAGLDLIYLIAPNTNQARIETVCAMASGFVYFVAIKGVTGSSSAVAAEVGEKIKAIRAATSLPVGVGFGIRDARSAEAMAGVADAVIVGTALVERMADPTVPREAIPAHVARLVAELRAGVDAAAA